LRTVRCAEYPRAETFRNLAFIARPEGLDDSGAPGPELDSRPLGARIANGPRKKARHGSRTTLGG